MTYTNYYYGNSLVKIPLLYEHNIFESSITKIVFVEKSRKNMPENIEFLGIFFY